MDIDAYPDDLWNLLDEQFPGKSCPFCNEIDWVPLGITVLDLGGRRGADTLVVVCRSCGFQWLHSVEMILRFARKSRRR